MGFHGAVYLLLLRPKFAFCYFASIDAHDITQTQHNDKLIES